MYTTEKDNRLSLLSHGYILLKIIGKGSFAVIWKAVCERKHGNSFYVAIKVASNTTDSRIDVVSWLKNEAMIISKLSGHPNIVSFYGEVRKYFKAFIGLYIYCCFFFMFFELDSN